MHNIKLNYYVKIDIKDWIDPDIKDKIRCFLAEKCKGDYVLTYAPASIITSSGIETMDRSYMILFFENKSDLVYFKLKWE